MSFFLEALLCINCLSFFLAISYLAIILWCLCKNVDFIYLLLARDGRLTLLKTRIVDSNFRINVGQESSQKVNKDYTINHC